MTPWKQKKLTTILAKNGNCIVSKLDSCYGCPVFKCRNQKRKDKSGISPSQRYDEAKKIMKNHILFPEEKNATS